jgi:hypothetical protein
MNPIAWMLTPNPAFAALRRGRWRLQRAGHDALRLVRGRRWQDHHRGLAPRIVATLLVRDEADIVAALIEHTFHIGVDLIIAMDNGSVDGTTEILRAYEQTGRLHYRHQPALNYRQSEWVTAMARDAATAHGASWVANLDADEFLWTGNPPHKDSLKQLLAGVDPRHGLVGLRQTRFSIDPALRGGWLDTATVQRPGPNYQDSTYNSWKVLHRADPQVRVLSGNHMAHGPRIGSISPLLIEVMHFPDRGYAQYAQKIRNGGSALRAGKPLSRRYNILLWREYPLLEAGTLEQAYRERQALTVGRIAQGVLKRDTRLRDHLQALLPSALRPDLLKAAIGVS